MSSMREIGGITTVAALALFLAGCGDNEARRFGYKGLDLEPSEAMYFTTGPAVTNWVPARVLSVTESYDLSDGEKRLLAAAGVVNPGEDLAALPAGYSKQDAEPWFVTWTKPAEAFGFKGVDGFLSHYDEDRSVWMAGETYFSSYWKTEAEAVAALAKLRTALGAPEYGVKKFYDFEHCFVAEYVRLRVFAVTGAKADGRWSCMLNIQDKNRPGCGQWESLADQKDRLNLFTYARAMKAYRAAVAKTLSANHASLVAALDAGALKTFVEGASWQQAERESGNEPCFAAVTSGTFTNALEAVWTAKLAEIKEVFGLVPAEGQTVEKAEDAATLRTLVMGDARFDLRLDAIYRGAAEPPEGEAAAPEAATAPFGEWRLIVFERLQGGFTLPKRPVLAK